MTDFNRIKPNNPRIKADAILSEAFGRTLQRPLLFPSLILFIACYLTFVTGSKIPLILISVMLIAGVVLAAVKRNISCFWGSILSLMLISVCCLRLLSVFGASVPSSSNGIFTGTVVSCEKKLSGSEKITATIGGINVELRLNEGKDIAGITPGTCFAVSGKFKEPATPGNPGEFDYNAYLKSKGIRYVFYAETFEIASKPSGISRIKLSFPDFCFQIRRFLFERFTGGRSEEEKSLIAAVCLGDSSLAEEKLIREFKISGCSHLLAVSGTHFAGFLILLPYILGALMPDRKKSGLIYVFFAFVTACITGWSESVTRAAFMSSCAFTGKDTISAMSLAAMAMILCDPFCSSRTGFLLSFSACIAIKLLSGRIALLLSFFKDKKAVIRAFSAQIAAIIGILPFSGITGSRFGIVQFIVQAGGSILAKVACMMFVPGVILSLILPSGASYAVSAPTNLFLFILKNLVRIGCEYSIGTSFGKPMMPIILFSFWLFIFLKLMPPFSVKKILLKASCILLAVCTGLVLSDIFKPLKAEIVFADVGQGDCCLIIAGNKTCLIDGGTYEKGDSAVIDLLDHYGIDKVDVAFMTHWDQDHAGGIAALKQNDRVRQIYTGFNGTDEDTDAFCRSIKKRNCDPEAFRSSVSKTDYGDVFELSDKVKLEVIYPEECLSGGNPGSLVIMLECSGVKMLFTGDIGEETEKEMVSKGIVSKAAILKVSHHGSRYASGTAFLDAASPEISVISVGRNNLYGHPSPETVGRLEKAGSRIYRTDRDGAVIIEFY